MIDRETVIRGLEICAKPSDDRECSQCPIGFGKGCALRLKREALELLKAEEVSG